MNKNWINYNVSKKEIVNKYYFTYCKDYCLVSVYL